GRSLKLKASMLLLLTKSSPKCPNSRRGLKPAFGNSRASELELKCEPQHAGIGDRRGLTADAPRQVGFDGCSERLAFSQDCVRIDDIENLAFGRQGHVFAGMEDLPEADVELIQTGRESGARRHQRDQLR